MVAQRRWIGIAGVVSFVAVLAAACDAHAGWNHRYRASGSAGSSGGSSGGSYGSYGSSGGSSGGYTAYAGGSSGGSYGSYGSSGGSSGGSWGSHHAAKRAMRAYRHSSHGGSYGSGGSSGGGYASGGSSGGSSGGGYASGGSSGGSYGGYASAAYAGSYTAGYSSGTPIESYRVINETPSMTGGEIINAPSAPANDSTSTESVPADGALLVVEVPAEAKVFVNGVATTSTGSVRRYLSRGLVAGKRYEYVVRIAVDRDGTPVEETKVVSLTAGAKSQVSFASAEPPRTSVTLRVPADAKVWLAGNATASSGAVRHFETTSLQAGQSWPNYEIRVSAVVDGQERTVSKVIALAAGDSIDVELDPAARTADAASTASLR